MHPCLGELGWFGLACVGGHFRAMGMSMMGGMAPVHLGCLKTI